MKKFFSSRFKLSIAYLIMAFAFISNTLCSQLTIPNNGFEESDTSTTTHGKSWYNDGNRGFCKIDSSTKWQGKNSILLSIPPEGGAQYFFDEFKLKCPGLTKYKVTCAVKIKKLKGMVGIRIKIFDKTGHQIAGTNAITLQKNQDWKLVSGEFYSDESAETIAVFGILGGSGDVWIDEITISEISMNTAKLSPEIEKYLQEFFTVVNANWIIGDLEKTKLLHERAKTLCAGSNDLGYCHSVIKKYLTFGLDDHCNFASPADWKSMNNSTNEEQTGEVNYATGKMLPDKIAYINVPTFMSFDKLMIQNAVDTLQTLIKRFDNENPSGWIIDLSNNGGGNSFAMFPGLGPLIGNGICGISVSAGNKRRVLMYEDGIAGWDSVAEFVQKSKPYHLKNQGRPIAVIQGGSTVSSGEICALAFKDMHNSKSFGQETAGATTRVDNFPMSDGAYLFLSAGYDADRNGVVYKSKIPPDVRTTDYTQAIESASKWILNNNSR